MANISAIKLPDNSNYDLRASAIPFGIVDSSSTSTAFTATVPGITALEDGVICMLKNGVVTSASGFTINVNGLGAKPVYSNMAAATAETTMFNINYTMIFVYDETRVTGGCWVLYRGYNSNDNTIGYQIRTNSLSLPVSGATGRYRILFTSPDGTHFVPPTLSTSTNATAKRDVNTAKIDPFGRIVYYSSTTILSAEGRPGASSLWQQYTLALGYSFNRTGAALTMTLWEPVFVKCTPQSDGSAIIDADTPYVQDLPSTADGKIYILLGIAYSATNIELTLEHPVYEYKDGKIRQYTIETDPTVPSWAKQSTKPQYTFSEIESKPTTLSGYGITDAKIASGVITLGSNTITPLTSSSTLNAAKLSGAIPSDVTATTQSTVDDSTKIATTAFVHDLFDTVTDTKLQVAEVTSATQYYPIVGTGTTATERQYDTTGFKYKGTTGTTSVVGSSILELGNSTASGTAGNKQAQLVMYGTNAKKATITLAAPSADIALALPTSGGTLALASQIPTVPSSTGSATTGISIAAHGTGTITGVQSSTTSVRGVKTDTLNTASHVKSGGNGTAPTLGTAISLIGVQSSTTSVRGVKTGTNSLATASKVSFGNAFSVPNVTGVTDITVPIRADADITVPVAASTATTVPIKATSATTVPIKNSSATSIPNVTAVGSGDASLTFAMDTTDTKKLKITFSHTHTPPTLGTAISLIGVQSSTTSVTGVQSSTTSVTGVSGSTTVRGVKTGTSSTTTASKVTLGTAFSIPNPSATDVDVPIRADSDVTVPIKNTSATSIPNVTSVGSASNWEFENVNVPIRADADTTVPIKNVSATTVVTGTTHTITDNGHTHTV